MAIDFRPERLTYDQIAAKARDFLEEFHPSDCAPIPIDRIVEFDLGIDIIPFDCWGVEAMLSWDRNVILVDEDVMMRVPNRYRFSLAHEVAHLVLHFDLYDEVQILEFADVRRIQNDLGESYIWMERQADNFAGLLLVPPHLLREQVGILERRVLDAGHSVTSMYSGEGLGLLVEKLSKTFGVSAKVIEIRLTRDGLIS